ncbi:MAG: hypothetical protein JWP92_3740 [Caulobacter sp.]|nr:hypothetical protein [Caulobacter sp.]
MARTDLEQLVYQMSAELKQLTAANKRALVDVKNTTTRAQRDYDKLAAEMGRGFGRASLAAGVAFGAIVGYATKAASDASETANAFSVAFGSLEKQAQAFAKSYSSDVGRALDETQATLAKTQLVLTGVGVAAKDALGMTEAIQRRAVDIGSLWNVSDAEAYQAILSGISGEAEPLKKFGVALNEAAVKAELLRLGFKGNADQAPEAAKAIARLNIILKASASADGDAIKTKDGLANSTKRAQAEFRDAAVALGQNFLPTATLAAHAAADLLEEFNKLPDGAKLAGLAMLGLVAGAGPITAVITGLTNLIKFAGAARLAILAIPGSPAAASAAAAAAAGAPIAATAAVLALSGDTRRFTAQDALNARLADEVEARKKIAEYEDKTGASAQRKLQFWKDALATTQAEIVSLRARERAETRSANRADQRKKAASGATSLPSTATPATTNFGLTPDLMKPTGGAPKKTGKSEAEKAADLTARQDDRFNADLARAKDDELRSREGLNRSIEEQARIALDRLKNDETARAEDLRLAVQKKELTQTQADLLVVAEGKARDAQREAIQDQKSRDLAAVALRQAQEVAGYELDVLQSQAALATTFSERLAIERRILALRQSQESAGLEQDLSTDPNLTPDMKLARRRGLAAAQASAVQALDEGAIANLKANILSAFEAAKGGIGSLADFFGDRLKAKLLENLADGLARWVMKGGGGGASSLDGLAKVGQAFAGLFDGGGNIPTGMFGVAGERGPEIVKGPASVVGRLDTLRAVRSGMQATPANQGGSTTITLHQTIDLTGANGDATIRAIAYDAAIQGFQAARVAAGADLARKGRNVIP